MQELVKISEHKVSIDNKYLAYTKVIDNNLEVVYYDRKISLLHRLCLYLRTLMSIVTDKGDILNFGLDDRAIYEV